MHGRLSDPPAGPSLLPSRRRPSLLDSSGEHARRTVPHLGKSKLLYLSRRDVADVDVPMSEIVATLQKVFKEKGEGAVEMPPKPGLHPRPDSSIRAMLAYIPSIDAAGVKWISGYGRNYIAGLPNINGLIVLNETETGLPKVIMDCTWVTAKRTGAAAAVAALHLARRDASTVGIVACGALGRTNLEALALSFKLQEVRAYDVDFARASAFAAEATERHGIRVVPVRHLRRALEGMDIVVTSGPIVSDPSPVIDAAWMCPGSFGCALDFDATFRPQVFAAADLLVTDDLPQLEYFRGTGYFRDTPDVKLDLGRLVASGRRRRRRREHRTMAILLGIGALDVAVASLVYDQALRLGTGTELPF